MRIVGGQWGGRRLVAPKGDQTRPTTDSLRETIFNILTQGLGHDLGNVLDLFAGSGALSFESLSRGASSVVLVESDSAAQKAIVKNAQELALSSNQWSLLKSQRLELWASELSRNFSSHLPFSTVFCDPPYTKNLVSRSMMALEPQCAKLFILGTILVVEISSKEESPKLPIAWELFKERSRGSSQLLFYRRS